MAASVDTHVDALATHLGRPLSLGAEGTLELRFDDGIAVTLELTAEQALYVYSVMGPAPVGANALRSLLETHFFGQLSRHVRFAIDPGSGELLLIEKLDLARLPPHEMPEALETFLVEVRRQRASEPWLASGPASDGMRSDGLADRPEGAQLDRSAAVFPAMRV